METFRPSRLTLARRRRGLTKARLAEMLDLTVRSISAYENEEMVPSLETASALAKVLGFPETFFFGTEIDVPTPDSASFRAASSMTSAQRDAALGAGALAVEFSKWVDRRFTLPSPCVPDLRGCEPEAAAESVRAQWGLGEKPIPNLVHLLESKGVRVFSLAEECLKVNAFSLWREDTPFIFLNTMKSAECSRFDAAHELGHLVLHGHGDPKGRDLEKDADAFASAFLMPRASVLAAAPRFPTLPLLIKLKKTWKVSVAALAYRLRSVDVLSEWHYRTLCIDIAQRGYRTSEPESIPRETSQLLGKVFAMLREDGKRKSDIARELLLYPEELDALVFGLVVTPLSGNGDPNRASGSPRGNLRLVSNSQPRK